MKPLSSLGIGLSLVFGCLFLALVAEVYYLLWWKKKIANGDVEDDYASSPRELLYLFCWRKPSSLQPAALNPQELCSSGRATDASMDAQHPLDPGSAKEFLIKSFGGDEGVEAELMRLHNLSGPPRFLFTIKEETKEDMESEDGRSRGDTSRKGSRGRSLSDVLLAPETPFLTPLSSPPFFTPPLTPMDHCYSRQGFNPLFESSKDDDWSRIRSSPPPKFKFLRDAEDKLYRKTLMEEALKVNRNRNLAEENAAKAPPFPASAAPAPSLVSAASAAGSEEEDGSFITIIISKSKEQGQHQHPPSSSQGERFCAFASWGVVSFFADEEA
ncbi:hypothetical protein Taro_051977 [Colocasia esculenta]|uniref:Uncharacterized protein n=1 Tax=Colocasia esculenta TaxID=4460 RepID=A0A843XI05_COLES|nr:hypothetical protein [Colocasia esculenta]